MSGRRWEREIRNEGESARKLGARAGKPSGGRVLLERKTDLVVRRNVFLAQDKQSCLIPATRQSGSPLCRNASVISSVPFELRGETLRRIKAKLTGVETLVERYQLPSTQRMTSDGGISPFFYFKNSIFERSDEDGMKAGSNLISLAGKIIFQT